MRRSLPLLVLLCLAFAPAPFPKTHDRAGGDRISLRTFQGTWKMVSIEAVERFGRRKAIPWSVTHVRVEGDLLCYLTDARALGQERITIDGSNPAHIDLYPQNSVDGKPSRVGLIKKEGERVTLLFYQVGPEARAKSFEAPPPHWWWAVFERER